MLAKLFTMALMKPSSDREISEGGGNHNFRGKKHLLSFTPSLHNSSSSSEERSAIEDLLLTRFCICCVIFDFTNPKKKVEEKQIKREALLELLDYMPSVAGSFTDTVMEEFVSMIELNIFRSLPPRDEEGALLAMDLSWFHLQLVYDILVRFIESKELDPRVASKYINHSFIEKLLGLFNSTPYPPEREMLKTLLHHTYLRLTTHRAFIRKAVNGIFHQFLVEPFQPNGIAELLEVYGSIISGFSIPLKDEHKLFLERSLMPLHKPDCVWVYHKQLSFCVVQFARKDPKLASNLIKGLLKYWPVTSSQTEMLFLQELEGVLEVTEEAEFRRCMVPLFRRIRQSLSSSHSQVAVSTIFLWKNDHIVDLVAQNRRVILPLIIGALEENHWNVVVNGFISDLRKQLLDLDHELFESCQMEYREEGTKTKARQDRREKTWKQLEALAITKSPGISGLNPCLEA